MIKHEKTIAACVVTYNRKDKLAKSSENKSKIIRAYLSPFKQCVRVLFKAKDNKFGRIRIIVKGLLQGIIFSPEIEYLEDI